MGYHVVRPSSIEPREDLSGDHHYLDDVVDLQELSVQLIEAAPGDSFAPYHSHPESEEVLYVLAGELHVETPEKEHVVSVDESFVVEPGNPLRPFNPESAEEPVRALLLNANLDDFTLYDAE